MNRIEDIVYYDFQGWPEYKITTGSSGGLAHELTYHLMATPRLDNLFIRPFISLKSIHFMPDFSASK